MRLSTLLTLALVACSPTEAPTRCTPNVTIACVCPGGVSSGVQACDAAGNGYGACQCEAPDGGTEDAVAALDVIEIPDAVVTDTSCGTGRVRCGAACVDTLTDGTNCGTCGRVCGSATSCVSGTCVAGDAGAVDAGAALDVAGPDVIDAGAADGGLVTCRTADQPVLRRCAADSDCNACAPFTAGFAWCCGITGYCENRRSCSPDAGFRPYRPGVLDACEGLGTNPIRCRQHDDCSRACAPRADRVWCCGAGGECGTREGTSCS